MKKIIIVGILCLVCLISSITEFATHINATNVESPYYTYTADSYGNLIKTSDAYLPGEQLNLVNDEKFVSLEHIYIDENDYLYITDSKIKTYVEQYDSLTGEVIINEQTGNPKTKIYTGKIIVLDGNLNLIGEIYDENINFPKSTFVTEDKIYIVDFTSSNILIYDKLSLLEDQEIVLLNTIGVPTHPIFQNVYDDDGEKISSGYQYHVENIAVDKRGNIYVQGIGSTNGLIMLDETGDFMTFFGGNPLRVPIIDKIKSVFLNEEQKEKMQDLREGKIYYDVPSNITIDDKGFVYTVTSSIKTNPIKKFNVSGRNYFNTDMIGTTDMNSVWVGNYNNVFSVNEQGNIFEYDTSGNLLFLFGGKDYTSRRVGLLTSPVSIAVNSKDQILVADKAGKFIQFYTPTTFTNSIHTAFKAYYDEGNYELSQQNWKYVLEYNSMFDYAHIGLGDSYMRDKEYSDAFKEFSYANDFDGMSDAFWSIRQEWMQNNLNIIFLLVVILVFSRVLYILIGKYFNNYEKEKKYISRVFSKFKLLDEVVYLFTFLKHPFNGFHEIKREKRVSVLSSTIIYIFLVAVFVLHYSYTDIIFLQRTNINVLYELLLMIIILGLFVISNYLVCTINDGEGTIKNVYNATAYSLSPILVILPIIIILSNFLTIREIVFYNFGFSLIILWCSFLMFFMIKDIHNYSVTETFKIILKSLFVMLIIGLLLYVINAMSNQVFTFIREVVEEVVNR